MKLFPYDSSDTYENSIFGKPTILTFCAKMMMKVQVAQAMPVNTYLYYSKAVPSIIDNEILLPNFAFRPHDVIQNTLRQTTQLAKSIMHHPMKRYLKSRFQMLRHKSLNEAIAAAAYVSSERSIERYYCAKGFFGMTSTSLYPTGMKTESKFPDVY
jgi:hypothetical protein